MLVLTRQLDQRIIINDNITIVVQRIRHNAVRLAIEAPADVPIKRGELRVYRPGEKKKGFLNMCTLVIILVITGRPGAGNARADLTKVTLRGAKHG